MAPASALSVQFKKNPCMCCASGTVFTKVLFSSQNMVNMMRDHKNTCKSLEKMGVPCKVFESFECDAHIQN